MLELKDYQKRTLQALRDYFRTCVQEGNPDDAFYKVTRQKHGQGIPYNPVKELPGLPYICLRLPTGGGKTLVASYSIAVTAQELLHTDNPVVLWLTPSNTIREQTLKALKNLQHPYRQALAASLGSVTILDISEALYVQPSTLSTSATIIVSTMQAFRVEDTEGRKVYEPSGALMSHFSGIPGPALEGIERYENGEAVTSLANVLRLHRPVVIVDEAHNARTGLSFETLARFRPSCILEFTATPDTEKSPSNILHTVSAAELKAEGMIKLPISLETHPDWRKVVACAVSKRNELEEIANQERAQTGEYIRPIVLLQAQPRYKNRDSLTVDVLEDYLVNDQRIPTNQVARATGTERGIEGVDLFASTCPIRYIITVQALREGWDCPFAYVLCSVAEMSSQTAVEQILGRVLRLPKAKSKQLTDLNKAYAFAASAHFVDAANTLADALIQNGFEKQEVRDLIRQPEPTQSDFGPLFAVHYDASPVMIPVEQPPTFENLPADIANKVSYDPATQSVAIRERLEPQEVYAVVQCFKDSDIQKTVEAAIRKAEQPKTASEKSFSVPVLAVKQGDFFEQFDESFFLERSWNLAKYNAYLSEAEYPSHSLDGERGEIDVDAGGRVRASFVQQLQSQMAFLAADQRWDAQELAVWLDSHIPHKDVPYAQSIVFFTNLVERLIADRGLSLAQLVQDRYRLKASAAAKVAAHRLMVRQEAFQQFLLPDAAIPLVVHPETCFTYPSDPMSYPYPPNSLFAGQHPFRKHYYPAVGDFKAKGEEYQCALFLDKLPQIDVWVRNLEGRPQHSFWLQTSSDRFYPDFVCRLNDGKYLVVEYKGEDRWSNDDSKEKRAIGQVWEERSHGECLFIMPKGPDFCAIMAKIGN